MFSIFQLCSAITALKLHFAGWYAAAGLLKGFGGEAQGGSVSAAAKKAAFVWAVGIPVSPKFPSQF